MDRWWVNGNPRGQIAADDRGLAYGDGLFETIAVRGGRARFLDRHLERLASAAGRLGIPCPDSDSLRADLVELAGPCARGVLKLILTRGSGPRGYAPPAAPRPTLLTGLLDGPALRPENYRLGVRTRLCRHIVARNPALAGMKTLNRLEQVVARREWSDPAIAEGLMSDEQGYLVGGTASNLFIVRGGALLTPSIAACGIRGIMRDLVIECARRQEIGVRETQIHRDTLPSSDELFLTNALIGLWPIAGVDSRAFRIGPVTRSLMSGLAQIGVEECEI